MLISVAAVLCGATFVGVGESRLTHEDMLKLHKAIASDVMDQGTAGRYRTIRVRARGPVDRRLWQRNYYEHIIRDDKSLNHIRQYILDNPTRWTFDRENPEASAPERGEPWH